MHYWKRKKEAVHTKYVVYCSLGIRVFLSNPRLLSCIYYAHRGPSVTVPHQRLLEKLRAHGIDGLVCNWIKAWLSNRQQRVCVDGSQSSWRPVWSGVPQGSVLGPVLFLVFINDLDIGVNSKILKFADDTKLFRPVLNHSDGLSLQQDLDTVCSWATRWNMEFNVPKCKVMHYGKCNIGHSYAMNGQPVEEVRNEKDLAVIEGIGPMQGSLLQSQPHAGAN